MLIAVRHGSTKFNSTGEKLRGWLDLPLSREGKEEAIGSAEKLGQMAISNHIEHFHTSPLKRAVQTSEIIGNELDKAPKITNHLKDWHIGNMEGQDVKKTLPTMHRYIENPDEKIPGGESYNTFLGRVEPYIRDLITSPSTHLAVTHNRVLTLINALSKTGGQEPDINTLKKKGPVEPGGIMMVDPNYNITILHNGHKSEENQ